MADNEEAASSVDDSSSQPEPSSSEPSSAPKEPQPPPDIEPTGKKNQPATISNMHPGLEPGATGSVYDETIMKECEECHIEFLRSYLYRNFSASICDDCRDPKGAHELITRTDAKSKYLLKDCDLDLRSPPLRYMLKKNPYHSRGDMRLYLKFQIEERALLVHESEEQLEEELERREERRMLKKQKTYEKKMKSLSMQVRSSLYKHKVGTNHEHEYGEPICIDDDKDLYRKECKTCGHKWEYEEM